MNKPKKILIAEDELAYVKLLTDKLTPHYYVIDAGDGKATLETAMKERPDLILLDIRMPIMDGLAVLRELRKNQPYGKNVKVIVLTNLEANDEIVEEVTTNLPTYYFVKSDISLDNLLKKIDELLAKD